MPPSLAAQLLDPKAAAKAASKEKAKKKTLNYGT